MAKMGDVLCLPGKTITQVIFNQRPGGKSPTTQIFLDFSDGSYAEIYSNSYMTVSGPRTGNSMEYAKFFDGMTTTVFK
jgi:hypothetical protein